MAEPDPVDKIVLREKSIGHDSSGDRARKAVAWEQPDSLGCPIHEPRPRWLVR